MTTEYQPVDALIKATENGPHKGWTTFGVEGEGTCFQDLHDLLSKPDFETRDAEELVGQIAAIVQSYGYGVRDSHLAQLGDINPDELDTLFDTATTEEDRTRYAVLLSNREDDNGDFADGDYFAEINRSLRALKEIGDEAASFVATARVFDRLYSAYETGMKIKDDEISPSVGMKP